MSLRRVGDLQDLFVFPSGLEFTPGKVKAIIYVPKVQTNVAGSIVLQAFHPPSHVLADQEKLHLVCPVRILEAHVHRSSHRGILTSCSVLWVSQEGVPSVKADH